MEARVKKEENRSKGRVKEDRVSLCHIIYLRLRSLIAHMRLETVGIHQRPLCGSYPITSLLHSSSSMSLLVNLELCDVM